MYRFSANVVDWIKKFLNNRTQIVCINNVYSNALHVTSGMPQCSVIVPLLLNIFINDIVVEFKWSDIHGDTVIYADGSKLFSTNPIDLQNNLCTVESFLKNQQLSLASSKCVHLSIKRKCSFQNNKYFISNNVIFTCTSVKDLGVSISNDLKWFFHIA